MSQTSLPILASPPEKSVPALSGAFDTQATLALSKAGEIPGGGLQGSGVRSLCEMLVSAHPTLLRCPLQQDIESPLPYGEPWNTKVTQYGAAPGSSSATKSFSEEFYWGACVCVCFIVRHPLASRERASSSLALVIGPCTNNCSFPWRSHPL